MKLTIVTILNVGHLGDQQQVLAIRDKLSQKFSQFQIAAVECDDNDPNILKKLEINPATEDKQVLLICSKNGCDLVQRKEIQHLIRNRKFHVIWVGYQAHAELFENEQWFDRVALPTHIIKTYPKLAQVFGTKLVAMDVVPHSLKESDLLPALQRWNAQYRDETIAIPPMADRSPVGVFLGGDVPNPDETHLYWDPKEAFEAGKAFGTLALKEKKFLWITNNPRTGKFYPDSPNSKKPIIRQFKNSRWLTLDDVLKNALEEHLSKLSETDRLKFQTDLAYQQLIKEQVLAILIKTQTEPAHQQKIAHATLAPLDPVSAAFIQGVESSGLRDKRDFVFYRFQVRKVCL